MSEDRITTREVFDQLIATDRKVDLLVQRDNDADRIHLDFETRLRSLEAWRWKFAGAVALAVLLLSAFGYFIAQTLVGHH